MKYAPVLSIDKEVNPADKPTVKLVQEWLSLHGLVCKVDGILGPATTTAVAKFQEACRLPRTGVVHPPTFDLLVEPMKKALQPINPISGSLGSLAVKYAQQHIANKPREIGGQNRGPWVRLYCGGRDGDPWAWCAGFAFFCLQQAADTLHVDLASTFMKPSLGCDTIGKQAQKLGLLVDGSKQYPLPGWLFLVRRPRPGEGWHHTGLVTGAQDGKTITTAEGNTNDDGSREGYEAVNRIRILKNIDFVRVP